MPFGDIITLSWVAAVPSRKWEWFWWAGIGAELKGGAIINDGALLYASNWVRAGWIKVEYRGVCLMVFLIYDIHPKRLLIGYILGL